ncbi:MAG: tetratricopeptide repeat protein [Thermodesulfovibrionales bacterium]|nr:tetratricopeptide repeat protein [Thermodesulfovibrionales bacterium]
MASRFLNKTPFHLVLIALLGLLSYSNTFNAPFHFDDASNIVNNPIIKDFRYLIKPSLAEGLNMPFKEAMFGLLRTRYIGVVSFWLNYKAGGLDVTGYHIVNVAIHIANALLIYALVFLTFKTPILSQSLLSEKSKYIALFSGLFFVSHPVETQSVTYIVQRYTSLAALFYMLSLVLYIKWRLMKEKSLSFPLVGNLSSKKDAGQAGMTGFAMPSRGGGILYLLSVFSAVLAMKTKEIAFTLPLIITLYEFMFFKDAFKRRLMYLIPILLTMLIIPITLLSIGQPAGEIIGDVGKATRLATDMSRWDYLFTEFRVIVTYIRLLFLPINQNFDYDYPAFHSFFDLNVFLSFLFLLSIFGFAVYLLFRSTKHPEFVEGRLISFGIFFFFIALSVESSVIPILDIIFEHRVYLPSVGIFIAFTTVVFLLVQKAKNKVAAAIVLMSAVFTLFAFSYATYMRNVVWKDGISLWEDVVVKSPNKARAHYNLGNAYHARGSFDAAIEHYLTAIKLQPGLAEAHNELGLAYSGKGLIDNATEHFRIAVKLNHSVADFHFNLGLSYLDKGFIDEAQREFGLALQIDPNYSKAQWFINYTTNSK